MQFDSNNEVIQLCAQGMEAEAHENSEEAKNLFRLAWHKATNDFEKFTAAHYVARHQPSLSEKLIWNKIALEFALKLDDEKMLAHYPSLYLNIAKCYEDLNDVYNAETNYRAALSCTIHLPNDGYGKMIKSGIENGLARITQRKFKVSL